MRTKGFITIATGDEHFYRLAYNLKKSYDYQADRLCFQRLPWLVLVDRINTYTTIFDRVLLLERPTFSYMDKIMMLEKPPFDENIFVDADSLVYGDINDFFSFFPISGVAHFGYLVSIEQKGKGWFDVEDIDIWRELITYKINSHGGIIFFSDDEVTKRIFKTCLEIAQHFTEYKFREFEKPADEPIIALSMCIHNCKPLNGLDENICFYRVHRHIVDINISRGILSYQNKYSKQIYNNVPLIHWGNIETDSWLYKKEACRLLQEQLLFVDYLLKVKRDVKFLINRFKSFVYSNYQQLKTCILHLMN